MGVLSSGFEVDEQGGGYDSDSQSLAVRRAGAGAEAWRSAVEAQQAAGAPDHADFYGLTRELVFTCQSLARAMGLISHQVAGYADSVTAGEAVYDDSRQDDPRELLARAAGVLGDIEMKVVAVTLELNVFWSLIGRIGVEGLQSAQTEGESGESAP